MLKFKNGGIEKNDDFRSARKAAEETMKTVKHADGICSDPKGY